MELGAPGRARTLQATGRQVAQEVAAEAGTRGGRRGQKRPSPPWRTRVSTVLGDTAT